MITSKTANSKLKNLIKGSDFLEREEIIRDLIAQDRGFQHCAPSIREAIIAVATYKKALDKVAYSDTLEKHVYYLFEHHFYTDHLYGYQLLLMSVMTAFNKMNFYSQLSEQVGESDVKNFLDLLHRLHSFICMMDAANFRAVLQMEDLKYGDLEPATVARIKEEYEIRLSNLIENDIRP